MVDRDRRRLEMTESLRDFLASRNADSDTIVQATKYLLAELTGDKTESEMRAEMESAGIDGPTIDRARDDLKGNPSLIEAVCLLVLSTVWADEAPRDKIRGAVEEAKGKAPVVEIAVIAFISIYAMYLVATGGRTKQTKTVKRLPDGTLVETEEAEFAVPPTGALTELLKTILPFGK
jgi:hypothetical protein